MRDFTSRALVAPAGTLRDFALRHPGRHAAMPPCRHAATVRLDPADADDPATVAGDRVLATVVRGYGVGESDTAPALRMLRSLLHGFTTIEAAGGFQLEADVDASFDWAVDFLDAGLRRLPGPRRRTAHTLLGVRRRRADSVDQGSGSYSP